jgi:tetratricopeptide (TPR) repeat protein
MAEPSEEQRAEARGLIQQAQQARAQRRLGQAAGLYARAIELTPDDAATRREWALVLSIVGQRDRAVVEMRRALEARPDDARWHYDLADVLARAGEAEAALAVFERAAALDPAEALYPGRLSALTWRLRRRDEAAAWAERALAIDPKQEMARLTLARARLAAGEPDAAAEIASALAGDARGKAMAARGRHLVGEARDRQGRWDEAFDAHRAGNDLLIDTPAAAHALRQPIEATMASYAAADAGAAYERWASARYDDGIAPPVIVTGFPRCGTTMVEQILAAHPRITSADERPLYMNAHRKLGPRAMTIEGLDGLGEAEILECRRLVDDALRASVPEPERGLLIVDKHPVRTIELPLVARLFPEARVVFMLRDPRDVVLSAYFQDFEVNPAMARFLRLEDAAHFYASVMGFWRSFRERTGLAWMETRYEDLVADFEPGARELLAFVGEDWDEAVGRFHESAASRVVLSASADQVTERAHTRSVGRWRSYEGRLGPALGTLAPFVESLGYDPA